jgi:hypothetical protein
MALTAGKTELGTIDISSCSKVKFGPSDVKRMFVGETIIFPWAQFSLTNIKYDVSSLSNICSNSGTTVSLYWVDCSSLDIGDYVWTNSGRTTLAPSGYYGNGGAGSVVYYINPTGIVSSISICPTPTPTPTPTSTPTPTPTPSPTPAFLSYDLYLCGTTTPANLRVPYNGNRDAGDIIKASNGICYTIAGPTTVGGASLTVVSEHSTCEDCIPPTSTPSPTSTPTPTPTPTSTPTPTPTPTSTPTPTPTPTATPPCPCGFSISASPTITCDDNSGLNGRFVVAVNSSCNSYQVRLLAVSGGTTTSWQAGSWGIGTTIFTFTGVDDGTYNVQVAEFGNPSCSTYGGNKVVNCYVAPTPTPTATPIPPTSTPFPTPTPSPTPTPTPAPIYYYYALSTCWGQETSISVGRSLSSSYGTAVFLIGGICFQSNGITSGPSYDVDLDSYSIISGGCSDAACNPPTPTPTSTPIPPTPTPTPTPIPPTPTSIPPTPTPSPTPIVCYSYYNNDYFPDIFVEYISCAGFYTTTTLAFGEGICAQEVYTSGLSPGTTC